MILSFFFHRCRQHNQISIVVIIFHHHYHHQCCHHELYYSQHHCPEYLPLVVLAMWAQVVTGMFNFLVLPLILFLDPFFFSFLFSPDYFYRSIVAVSRQPAPFHYYLIHSSVIMSPSFPR